MRTSSVLVILCASGCASLQPISGQDAQKRTQSLSQGPAFFYATAKATYFDKNRRLKGELGLVVAEPDRLYVEVRGPGGTPVSTFVCIGGRAQLYDLEGPGFYEGEATALALGRILPVGLPPPQAVRLLAGRLPIPKTPTLRQAKGSKVLLEGSVEHLGKVRLEGGGDRWTLTLLDRGITLRFENRHPSGLFQRLEIVDKTQGREVLFQMVDLDLSGEAPADEVFRLEVPPGLEVLPL